MAIKFPQPKKNNNMATSQKVASDHFDSNGNEVINGTKPMQNDSIENKLSDQKAGFEKGNLLAKPKMAKTQLTAQFSDKWATLSSRDRAALVILSLFIVITVGGYGGYAIHSAATEEQENYQSAINDYFWLRAQSTNIDPSQGGEQGAPMDQQLNQMLSQAGVNSPQVLRVGDDTQISFTHSNQAIASNVLSTIVNSGYQIKQLTMQQNPEDKVIRIQATVGQIGG